MLAEFSPDSTSLNESNSGARMVFLSQYIEGLTAQANQEVSSNFEDLFQVARSIRGDQQSQFMMEHVEGPGAREENIFSSKNILEMKVVSKFAANFQQ